eukprot:COSAG05_NODE_681_length_7961_cov_105.324854_7_plen_626_part_01
MASAEASAMGGAIPPFPPAARNGDAAAASAATANADAITAKRHQSLPPQQSAAVHISSPEPAELAHAAGAAEPKPPALPPSVTPSGRVRADPRSARHLHQVEELRNRMIGGAIAGDVSIRQAAVVQRNGDGDSKSQGKDEQSEQTKPSLPSPSEQRHLDQVEALRIRLMTGSMAGDASIRQAAVAERNATSSATRAVAADAEGSETKLPGTPALPHRNHPPKSKLGLRFHSKLTVNTAVGKAGGLLGSPGGPASPAPAGAKYSPLFDAWASTPSLHKHWPVDLKDPQAWYLTQEQFNGLCDLLGSSVSWKRAHVWAHVMLVQSERAAEERIRRKGIYVAPPNQASFHAFVHVYDIRMGAERRRNRMSLKKQFEALQTTHTGLYKEQVARLVSRQAPLLMLLPPKFALENDWPMMTENGRTEDVVSFDEFELWWKARMGLSECSLPVIPEYFAYKLQAMRTPIGDMHLPDKLAGKGESASTATAAAGKHGTGATGADAVVALGSSTPREKLPSRNGAELWKLAKKRVELLAKMAHDWGKLEDIYGHTEQHSIYQLELEKRSRCLVDKESQFSAGWDVAQVVFLMYVSVTVPIRACMGVDIVILSPGWWVDTLVDLYFIADLLLNFFT